MKKICFAIISLFLFFGCSTQKYDYKAGYKYLEKAEKQIEQGKLAKAQLNLNEAKKCSWGFCGNATIEAQEHIKILESQVYSQKGEFNASLQKLDSVSGCAFGVDCQLRDSLKIEALFHIYGKVKVQHAFGSVANDSTSKDIVPIYLSKSIYLSELEYTFSFYIPPTYMEEYKTTPTFATLTEKLSYSHLLNLPK